MWPGPDSLIQGGVSQEGYMAWATLHFISLKFNKTKFMGAYLFSTLILNLRGPLSFWNMPCLLIFNLKMIRKFVTQTFISLGINSIILYFLMYFSIYIPFLKKKIILFIESQNFWIFVDNEKCNEAATIKQRLKWHKFQNIKNIFYWFIHSNWFSFYK